MLHARETTLAFFIMYLSPLREVYLLVNLFEKPVHNAIRQFSCLIYVHQYWEYLVGE